MFYLVYAKEKTCRFKDGYVTLFRLLWPLYNVFISKQRKNLLTSLGGADWLILLLFCSVAVSALCSVFMLS